MRRLLPAIVLAGPLLAAALAPGAASAQQYVNPPPSDQVVMQLQAERWVETKTAKVVALVQQAMSGEAAAKEQSRVPSALKELAPDAEWQVTSFDRTRDPAGLERWTISAEARLPETALGGIYDRAKSLGKPGRQVEITQVDFSPTIAEREATASALRADIYERAIDEAKRLTALMGGREFRVQRVDFDGGGVPRPLPAPMARMSAAPMAAKAEQADMGSGVGSVSERMVATASVVLASPGK